jgi:hypothetical protein
MDIVIHATKDGYRTLFTTDDELAYLIAKDVRSGANNDSSLGNFVHAVFFTEKGCVFTKYIIVKDTQRSNALGFIAFSIFVNNNKSLKGEDVVSILDELSNKYSDKYIINSYLNRGEKNLIREDWNFINDILRKYNELDKGQKDKEFHSGIKEAAFIYYNNEVPLREYFDKPLQEDYIVYKQVFFINTDLKGSQKNPLNILSNSGKELEGIDLKNEYYYLNNYNRSKGITIIANGKDRSDGKNNNSIRAKWQVEINYSKDERCFEPIQAKGTLSNPDSEIYKYLEVKNNQINIKYDAFNNPNPKTKSISIEIKDRKGNFIENADIGIGSKPTEKIQGHKYETTFSGEDLIKRYDILVKKGFFTGKIDFMPINQIGNIILELQEHKNVTFLVKDGKGLVFDYNIEVRYQQGGLFSTSKELEFIGEDIDKLYDITIVSNKHERKTFSFCPTKDENPKHVELQNRQFIDYQKEKAYELIVNDKFGKRSFKNKPINTYVHSKPNFGCDPKFGYEFIEWKQQEKTSNDYNGYFEAIFKELWYHKIPKWSILISLVVIGIITIFFMLNPSRTSDSKISKIDSEQITNYIEGDSLLLYKLNEFKYDLELHKPEVKEINSGLLSWFMGSEKQLDSTALTNWRNDTLNINEAINKRNLLNDKDFKKLKKLNFSSNQNNLIEVINKIDSTKYKDFSKVLGNVSDKTLSEIAVDIKSALKPKEPIIKKPQKSDKETVGIGNKIVPTIPINEKPKPASVKPVKPIVVDSPDKNKNIEISNKLKGVSISVDELNNFKDENPKFKNSIQLYIDFLVKVQNNNDQKQDYDNLLKKVKADDILKNSELKSFLNGICSNSDSFEKFKSTSGKKSCKTLEKLKNKM